MMGHLSNPKQANFEQPCYFDVIKLKPSRRKLGTNAFYEKKLHQIQTQSAQVVTDKKHAFTILLGFQKN